MKRILELMLVAVALIGLGMSCAPLQPGADPFIVTIERGQTMAEPAFTGVLAIDHADRGFWRTNAPAFHQFCEYLRQPVPWSHTHGRTQLQRYLAAQLQVSVAKADYRAVKNAFTSNALFASAQSLNALASQSTAWLTIVTNKPNGSAGKMPAAR